MNLIEQIKKGKQLIDLGEAQGKDIEPLEKKLRILKELLKKDIGTLNLSELSKRRIAIMIYSTILNSNIWICSNEEMITQVKEDEPGAITYSLDEIRKILNLNPNPEDLKAIHNAKSVFPNSHIVDSKLNNKNEEKEN